MRLFFGRFACVALALSLACAPFAYFTHASNVEDREWRDFSAAHHCRLTQRIKAGWSENASTTWTCDGGFNVVREP